MTKVTRRQIAQAFSKLNRGGRARSNPEQDLQIDVVAKLGTILTPATWFCRIPNGGERSRAAAGISIAMGEKPGAPDLLFLHNSRAFLIELKVGDGEVSSVQDDCHLAIERTGCRVYVCWTWDEILNVLREEKIPTRIVGGL